MRKQDSMRHSIAIMIALYAASAAAEEMPQPHQDHAELGRTEDGLMLPPRGIPGPTGREEWHSSKTMILKDTLPTEVRRPNQFITPPDMAQPPMPQTDGKA